RRSPRPPLPARTRRRRPRLGGPPRRDRRDRSQGQRDGRAKGLALASQAPRRPPGPVPRWHHRLLRRADDPARRPAVGSALFGPLGLSSRAGATLGRIAQPELRGPIIERWKWPFRGIPRDQPATG